MGVRGARWCWACRRTGMIVGGNSLEEGLRGNVRGAFSLLLSHLPLSCRRVIGVSANNDYHRFC